MAKLNSNKYIILGLLSQSSKSGYEIKKVIDENFNFYWKIGYNQIYPYLQDLKYSGLVKVNNKKSDKGPNQNIYILTDKGLEIFLNWLNTEIKKWPTFKNEVLVKLNFGSILDKNENIKLIEDYKKVITKRLNIIKTIQLNIQKYWKNHENFIFWDMIIDYGINISLAELNWCKKSIKRIGGCL